MCNYDYLIVGSGLYGCVFAHEMHKRGKSVLVLEKRDHVGGNVYTENVGGINVHRYGAHIFHTNEKEIWDYVNSFVDFNRYTNSPVAISKGGVYNLPFNMNTFSRIWGCTKPSEAISIIESQRREFDGKEPQNLEEQAVSLVGRDIFELLIREYTEKQWGRSCSELPSFIIKRLPVRFTYDNNYFNDKYQGIPIGGYTKLIESLLAGIDVKLGVDFFDIDVRDFGCPKIVYTGPIDRFFGYKFGKLDYRSLTFKTEVIQTQNYQGNAVINYIDKEVEYTRIIEHKHFEFGEQSHTVVTKEYPKEFEDGDEYYYPVNDNKNNSIYVKYKKLAAQQHNVIFGGRLAEYKYYDMHQVIKSALSTVKEQVEFNVN